MSGVLGHVFEAGLRVLSEICGGEKQGITTATTTHKRGWLQVVDLGEVSFISVGGPCLGGWSGDSAQEISFHLSTGLVFDRHVVF